MAPSLSISLVVNADSMSSGGCFVLCSEIASCGGGGAGLPGGCGRPRLGDEGKEETGVVCCLGDALVGEVSMVLICSFDSALTVESSSLAATFGGASSFVDNGLVLTGDDFVFCMSSLISVGVPSVFLSRVYKNCKTMRNNKQSV